MTRLTKKQYTKRMTELKSELDKVTIEYFQIPDILTPDNIDEITDRMNVLNDLEYELKDKIKMLEHEWDTRNWTGADWALHNLIANNID